MMEGARINEVIYTKLPEAEGNVMPGLSTQPPLVLHTQLRSCFSDGHRLDCEDPEEHCANLGPKNRSDVRGHCQSGSVQKSC